MTSYFITCWDYKLLVVDIKCVFGLDLIALRCVSVFFFFFFLTRFHLEYCGYCSMNSNRNCWLSAVNSAHMHCLRTHKFHFFINFFIKNGSHSTIHTFKNYFATVFSVFSFQFQQNKFYPNTPLLCCFEWKSCSNPLNTLLL